MESHPVLTLPLLFQSKPPLYHLFPRLPQYLPIQVSLEHIIQYVFFSTHHLEWIFAKLREQIMLCVFLHFPVVFVCLFVFLISLKVKAKSFFPETLPVIDLHLIVFLALFTQFHQPWLLFFLQPTVKTWELCSNYCLHL